MTGSNHRGVWRAIVAASGLLLGVSLLLGPASALAAPRPKSGPCVVSAGVTYTNRNLTVVGTSGTDTIDCSSQRKAMTILGNGGGDAIVGTASSDTIYADPIGTPLDSCVQGMAESSTIHAGGGADVIYGSVCNSVAYGGPGNDHFIATGGSNFFDGEAGDDVIDMRGVTEHPWETGFGAHGAGSAGNDTITFGTVGGWGEGGDGNDHLVGGSGADRLEGGAGDDSIEGNGGTDDLTGDEGIDQLLGGDGDDVLFDGSADNDTFVGGNNDTLTPPLPRPGPGFNGGWGDICADNDGKGSAPGDPDGSGTTGAISAVQNDAFSGCEYLIVGPTQ